MDSTSTPKLAPVEERWEESQGKYLHKKFKKMATSSVAEPVEEATCHGNSNGPSTSTPESFSSHPVPNETRVMHTPTMSSFPLKHNALSLVQDSSGNVT